VYAFFADFTDIPLRQFFDRSEPVQVDDTELFELVMESPRHIFTEITDNSQSSDFLTVYEYSDSITEDTVLDRFEVMKGLNEYIFDYTNGSILYTRSAKILFERDLLKKTEKSLYTTTGLIQDSSVLSDKKVAILSSKDSEESTVLVASLINRNFNEVSEVIFNLEKGLSYSSYSIVHSDNSNSVVVEVVENLPDDLKARNYFLVDFASEKISFMFTNIGSELKGVSDAKFSDSNTYGYVKQSTNTLKDSCLVLELEEILVAQGDSVIVYDVNTNIETTLYSSTRQIDSDCVEAPVSIHGLFRYDNGNYILTKSDGLYALDYKTGETKLIRSLSNSNNSTPATVISVHDGLLFMSDGSLLNTTTGKSLLLRYGGNDSHIRFFTNRLQ
jgi:hypothetical protein